jgi:beta-lactam-binding protein with PASTA domain
MKKRSFFNNIFIKNLLGMSIVAAVLLTAIIVGLNIYTQHGKAVEIPDVKGLSLEKAESYFFNNSLNYVIVDSVFIRNATPGSIIETVPPVGSMVKKGRTIYLKVIAYTPQLITIPDVKDTSQRQSLAMLQSRGFENIAVVSVPGVFRDLVLGLESRGVPMEAGQRVPANTPLSLLVSSGQEEIPDTEDPEDEQVEAIADESWF